LFYPDAVHVSPYAACCSAIFLKSVNPALAGRFFPGDEEQEARQRSGYQVTPQLSLSGLLPAGKKPSSVQKTAPPS